MSSLAGCGVIAMAHVHILGTDTCGHIVRVETGNGQEHEELTAAKPTSSTMLLPSSTYLR